MTGTIWTNKLKKRLGMTENDTCEICPNKPLEDAIHVLGDCADTRRRHNQIWQEILDIGIKGGLQTHN